MAGKSFSVQAKTQGEVGFITETDYMYGHFEELVPINMKYVAALNGFKTCSLEKEFTYLDLGCENGITLGLLAAAYPHARFIGIDSSAEHIQFAEGLQKHGKISNIKFIHSTLDKVDVRFLPKADFIVAHGLLSWVDDNVRNTVKDLVDKKLKAGGLLYINYNTLPGWSIKAPFLELMHYFTSEDETGVDRIQEGLKMLHVLCNEKSAFFLQNPMLKEELERLNAKSQQYLTHEYMSENWQAFYYREINDVFGKIGLQMAGSFPFRDNFKELIIPKNFHSLLEMQPDKNKYEEFKDFIINSRVRKNIYIRSDEQHVIDDHDVDLYEGIYFTTLKDTADLTQTVKIGSMNYDIKGPGYDILRNILPNQSYTMMELLNHADFNGYTAVDIINIVNNFVVLNQALPCFGPIKRKRKVDVNKMHMTLPINQFLLDHVYPKGTPITLACPATGTIMACNHVAAIVLDSLLRSHGRESRATKNALEMAHELHEDEIFKDEKAVHRAISQVENSLLIWLARMGVII